EGPEGVRAGRERREVEEAEVVPPAAGVPVALADEAQRVVDRLAVDADEDVVALVLRVDADEQRHPRPAQRDPVGRARDGEAVEALGIEVAGGRWGAAPEGRGEQGGERGAHRSSTAAGRHPSWRGRARSRPSATSPDESTGPGRVHEAY